MGTASMSPAGIIDYGLSIYKIRTLKLEHHHSFIIIQNEDDRNQNSRTHQRNDRAQIDNHHAPYKLTTTMHLTN
eukprot:scaffold10608_cov287-Chaetoceros_neogracile.AAC.3